MKNEANKKYVYTGLTVLSVVIISITFFFILFKFKSILSIFSILASAFRPFAYGLIFAYLLTPIFNFFYQRTLPFFQKHTKHPKKNSKLYSTLLTMFIAFFIIAGLLYLVLPQIVTTIAGLIENNTLQESLDHLLIWLQQTLATHPELEVSATDLYRQIVETITVWMKNDMLPQLNSVMVGVMGTLTLAKNLIVSIFITIYVLNSKETFAAQVKKLIYSIFSVPHANLIVNNTRFVHRTFGGFINGKLIDSLIIGVIAFIGMRLLSLPYAMLISVILGVTNIIPFFGPFIGAIPSALLIFMVSPIKVLYFLIFVFILQQFDGNFLGPKILGDSTGLSSFWVLFAILIFGGIFGFAGMLFGVPLFAVLYSAVKGFVNHSLQCKNLSSDTSAYQDLNYINPEDFSLCYGRMSPTEIQTKTKSKNADHEPCNEKKKP